MEEPTSRREFLKTAAGLVLSAALGRCVTRNVLAANVATMPRRKLGRTGLEVSLLALGCGMGPFPRTEQRAAGVEAVHRAIDLGVNYFDTAPTYGMSEVCLGEALAGRRREVIVATKTQDRSRDGSWRLLERSLKRLRTDYVDVWQIHNTRGEIGDVDKMFAADGVIKAMEQAREQKLVRFVGVTGHRSAAMVAEALRRYEFDTTLIALNAADRRNESFIETVLPVAQQKGGGVLAMKVPAYGNLLKPKGALTVQEAIDYALTHPISSAVIGCDSVEQLEENAAGASSFRALSADAMAALEARAMKQDVVDVSWFKSRW